MERERDREDSEKAGKERNVQRKINRQKLRGRGIERDA